VLYLQYSIPGNFSIVESSNPDVAPNGQFPFIIHEDRVIPTFALIATYVATLKDVDTANLDASLDITEKSRKVAWYAHVESNLGDLVHHTLYAHHGNWTRVTQPALASMFPVPQRYYVPGRMRECHKARLEAAGLWNLPEVEKQEKKPFKRLSKSTKEKVDSRTYLQTFEREKVLEKARESMDIYARLLGSNDFFFSDRPTTLDTILAAHILLLLNPPYPDPFLQTLVNDSYPTLSSHARRIYAQALESGSEPARSTIIPSFSWSSLIPWPPTAKKQIQKSPEDVHFDRMRWGFYGLAMGSLAAYLVVVGGSKYKEISARVAKDLQTKNDDVDVNDVEEKD